MYELNIIPLHEPWTDFHILLDMNSSYVYVRNCKTNVKTKVQNYFYTLAYTNDVTYTFALMWWTRSVVYIIILCK